MLDVPEHGDLSEYPAGGPMRWWRSHRSVSAGWWAVCWRRSATPCFWRPGSSSLLLVGLWAERGLAPDGEEEDEEDGEGDAAEDVVLGAVGGAGGRREPLAALDGAADKFSDGGAEPGDEE